MPEQLTEIAVSFWDVLSEMAPYLLFGFFVAGLLSVLISPQRVERHLGGEGIWPVFKAAAFGVPLPLCSCGVIPVSASLRRHGASRAATTSFLISTPQTGVDSIMVTWSLLGGVYAIYRPLAALVTGLAGGLAVTLTGREHPHAGSGTAAHTHTHDPAGSCQEPCCASDGGGKLRRIFAYGFITLPKDIGRALLIGLLVAALISALVPKDYFADVVPPGIAQMVVLMLAGIPVYVCATASVPLAYALIVAGVSPGAAFAFLMTGPATNAATIATIWRVMGKRTTAIYLASMIVGALGGGLVLDALITPQAVVEHAHQMGWMLPGAVKSAAAVVLLGVLAYGIFNGKGHAPAKEYPEPGFTTELIVRGMTCSHCSESVRRALLESEGVKSAEVDLAAGKARVTGEALDTPTLCRAISTLGYEAEPARPEENDDEPKGR